MDILQAPSKYIDVPEYLLYGDDLQKLLDNVVNVNINNIFVCF